MATQAFVLSVSALRPVPLPRSSVCGRTVMALQVDQRVRVSKSVIMNHVPGEKGGPYEMKGAEGVILKDISDGGKSCLSATCPFIVSFDNIGTSERPFKAHFEEHELEAI